MSRANTLRAKFERDMASEAVKLIARGQVDGSDLNDCFCNGVPAERVSLLMGEICPDESADTVGDYVQQQMPAMLKAWNNGRARRGGQ